MKTIRCDDTGRTGDTRPALVVVPDDAESQWDPRGFLVKAPSTCSTGAAWIEGYATAIKDARNLQLLIPETVDRRDPAVLKMLRGAVVGEPDKPGKDDMSEHIECIDCMSFTPCPACHDKHLGGHLRDDGRCDACGHYGLEPTDEPADDDAVPMVCPTCSGSGNVHIPPDGVQRCVTCKGIGMLFPGYPAFWSTGDAQTAQRVHPHKCRHGTPVNVFCGPCVAQQGATGNAT